MQQSRELAEPLVRFCLSVPGAFGSVWAMWSSLDVAVSLATAGAVKPMTHPAVQLAALFTASLVGVLSLLVHYTLCSSTDGGTMEELLPGAPDQELGFASAEDAAARSPNSGAHRAPAGAGLEFLSPLSKAGRSPSLVFALPDDPNPLPLTL